jgi:hypothetical protein
VTATAAPAALTGRVWPAHVTVPGATWRQALALLYTDRADIWVDAWPDPLLVARLPLPDGPPAGPAPWQIGTATIARSRGCGCGSRMRTWVPALPERIAAR